MNVEFFPFVGVFFFIFFRQRLVVSVYKSFTFLVKYIPNYFNFFDALIAFLTCWNFEIWQIEKPSSWVIPSQTIIQFLQLRIFSLELPLQFDLKSKLHSNLTDLDQSLTCRHLMLEEKQCAGFSALSCEESQVTLVMRQKTAKSLTSKAERRPKKDQLIYKMNDTIGSHTMK